MLDKTDRKLLKLLQKDCSLSLNALAEAVNLTSTPCWKRLKRLEDEGYIVGKVALLDSEKLGLGLTVIVMIRTQQHSSDWYEQFVAFIKQMPEVLAFYRMAGECDYLMHVEVVDMKSYDLFYKRMVNGVPGLIDVTSSFAMEKIKYTTALPIPD
ncbi:winged helix-turn-helix transcriptional regulator [Photorhabdus laumondii subsp. laumondii]|uniref:DNA-binding transcriptional activator DecR n=2 Tax=Photorhabdus laumondii subsp. laumondii TaxID=141679 RepID=Q7N0M2_PHOLL|nr:MULTISPECIES: Lrp/AsnC family transcriptional regulator [Photorhabdus]AWK43468.1 transcriptional regulator [Photorhabdus laumondii subsp. laumondii]AXG44146.1 Lrp/AsnC family transcriptional regulator [Photorhabdus laumondii subsp. laumondii]AXG48774.1 Lrp/AsnC family transcriptional regulator [Photorhabdus laumondii subsp. laumondii]KTL63436.1 transcriptional regulator [Photorhabdus laumondii subsp. laumondii]MCC8383015.1 Lrp/AsnC family transcriptional regulator [Photorhabdus laumondii]